MMRHKRLTILLCLCLTLCGGCAKQGETSDAKAAEQVRQATESFQTTARVKYQDLETVMTIYKKPMNCAVVGFESPKSLQDMTLTFYPEKVNVKYQQMQFDFAPDSVPGQAAAKLVLSAVNASLAEQGITITQEGSKLLVSGEIEEGAFSLIIDAENGNILKLSIPAQELELEILNFQILE